MVIDGYFICIDSIIVELFLSLFAFMCHGEVLKEPRSIILAHILFEPIVTR